MTSYTKEYHNQYYKNNKDKIIDNNKKYRLKKKLFNPLKDINYYYSININNVIYILPKKNQLKFNKIKKEDITDDMILIKNL